MSPMTSQCLSAAGITQVVWIDDFFDPPTQDELFNVILTSVQKLKEEGLTEIQFDSFSNIDLTRSKNEIEDDVQEILQEMPEKEIGEAANRLTELAHLPPLGPKALPDDLSIEDFTALKQAFGAGLRTFCLGGWTSEGVQQFASASENTLFLIDKEYKRENPDYDGTLILKDLVNTTSAFCIMLTHTWVEAEQEERRLSIANANGLPPHKFCVLSKQQHTDLPIDPRFARAIRTIMTHRFNGEIAFTISRTIEATASKTAGILMKQAVSDIEQALFENADDEGVLEYDAVLRVFEIEQRHALNQALQDAVIQNQVRASRKFRQETGKLKIEVAKGDMGFFRGWRAREVFVEGDGFLRCVSAGYLVQEFRGSSSESIQCLIYGPCNRFRKCGKPSPRRVVRKTFTVGFFNEFWIFSNGKPKEPNDVTWF